MSAQEWALVISLLTVSLGALAWASRGLPPR